MPRFCTRPHIYRSMRQCHIGVSEILARSVEKLDAVYRGAVRYILGQWSNGREKCVGIIQHAHCPISTSTACLLAWLWLGRMNMREIHTITAAALDHPSLRS